MLKLEKIFIENIKSIKNAEINFGDLTVVTGVNSSGKSSLIQSILYLAQWYGSAEFMNNEDEFYIPHLSIYDRYLVNKNRSYEGLKNDINRPIKIGFKNQNQELKITFSNGSHSGLRINPEHIDLKNLGMNRTIKFERFPKLTDGDSFIDITKYTDDDPESYRVHKFFGLETLQFIQSYFLGNIYFDLIGNSISKEIKTVNSDLEAFSISSIFNYDLDEILEKRNLDNEKLNKFIKTNNQLNFYQSTNLSNGILKLTDRNFGDSYALTNSKINNLFSKRYRQDINTNSLVLKETNFFLQFFLSKLPKELLEETSFGSGIREEEDFFDFSDNLIKQWKNASKKIIFQNLLQENNFKKIPDTFQNLKYMKSKAGNAENIFYVFQLFINNLLSRNSIINPLELSEYVEDFIRDLSDSKTFGKDNVSRRLVFDAIDELEYLIAGINKDLLEDNLFIASKEEFSKTQYQQPSWNDKNIDNVEQIKKEITSGKKPYIGVVEDRDGLLEIIDGISAYKAYEELGINKIPVSLISDDNFCICNNKAWESDDRDIDLFIDKSQIENTKTYICPLDSSKIHLGFFSRGVSTESADNQRYGTLFLYPEKNKKNYSKYDDPLDLMFDLFVFIDKNLKNKKILQEYFSFYYEDKILETLDDEIAYIKNFIATEKGTADKSDNKDIDAFENIPSYGTEFKSSRKKQKTDDYYDSRQSDESVFDILSLDEAEQTLAFLRKLKNKRTQEQKNSKKPSSKKLEEMFNVNVVLYEKSNMHDSLENIYPNPFSEKDSFLNDMNYLSTIRDPDDQNDPVGNYANLLPIGQNAGGLAEYLTLYGDRLVEPFISPKFSDNGEPLRKYEDLYWIKNDPMPLYDAIKLWLKYLGLKDFDFQVINEGTQNRIKFKGGLSPTPYGREITEIGSGIGKILPVIVNCLIAKKGQLVLIEEPETHLHPSAQTYLADFLFAMSTSRQIVIETHSPNIIDRLRFRNIHNSVNTFEQSQKPDIEIIFSELENNETQFRHGKIDDLGDIVFENTDDARPWPTGFFDNTDRDLTNILRARKEKFDRNLEE